MFNNIKQSHKNQLCGCVGAVNIAKCPFRGHPNCSTNLKNLKSAKKKLKTFGVTTRQNYSSFKTTVMTAYELNVLKLNALIRRKNEQACLESKL